MTTRQTRMDEHFRAVKHKAPDGLPWFSTAGATKQRGAPTFWDRTCNMEHTPNCTPADMPAILARINMPHDLVQLVARYARPCLSPWLALELDIEHYNRQNSPAADACHALLVRDRCTLTLVDPIEDGTYRKHPGTYLHVQQDGIVRHDWPPACQCRSCMYFPYRYSCTCDCASLPENQTHLRDPLVRVVHRCSQYE